MVPKFRGACSNVALLMWLVFFVSAGDAAAQLVHEGVEGVRRQGDSWQGRERNTDEDRWREESERVNRLRFDREGNWRVPGEGGGTGDASRGEEPSEMQRLREEGKRRERAVWLAWERRAKEIQEKWGNVREPSPTVYVAYTKDNDAFGDVDYKKGLLEVGAVAPVFFPDAPVRVDRLLSERLSFLLKGQSLPGLPDLEGQVRMPGTGRLLTQADVGRFSRLMVRSGEPPRSYRAPDGVRRLEKRIKIELVPNHLQTRVRRYLPYVEKAARIYEVDPGLILAVIHTESVFNPRAVSRAGAVGLMQVVPSSAGLEASKLVDGKSRLLSREELSRPDRNIEIGAAYLRILVRRHFSQYRMEPRKLLFLVIASYNCGPARVKAAIGDQDTRSLSPAEFYAFLLRVVPPETRVYLQRVVRNMKQYRSIMGRNPLMRFVIADFSGPRLACPLL